MVPEMLFTATEAIGFSYGVTWNTVRAEFLSTGSTNEVGGNLEAKVKSFCAVPQVLRFLKDFILFAEKEEELQKIILRQHQTAAVGQGGGAGARSASGRAAWSGTRKAAARPTR